jgi:hypothetical protein
MYNDDTKKIQTMITDFLIHIQGDRKNVGKNRPKRQDCYLVDVLYRYARGSNHSIKIAHLQKTA